MTITVLESSQITVSRLISLALKDIGVLAEGETASAEMMSDSLDTLRQMVAMWQVERIMVPVEQRVTFTATGAQSYAIGLGLTVDTSQPVAVESASYTKDGTDYPLTMITLGEYERIGQKAQSGDPEYACYVRSFPEGTLYLWPQPASGSVNLIARQSLTDYTALSDSLAVPKEYEVALRFSLAEMLATVLNMPPRPDIASRASQARRVLKRNNVQIPQLSMPDALVRHTYSITNG